MLVEVAALATQAGQTRVRERVFRDSLAFPRPHPVLPFFVVSATTFVILLRPQGPLAPSFPTANPGARVSRATPPLPQVLPRGVSRLEGLLLGGSKTYDCVYFWRF